MSPNLQVETAGDCYIVAGALMEVDEEGFMTLDFQGDASHGARNVVNFAQVCKGRTILIQRKKCLQGTIGEQSFLVLLILILAGHH